MEEYKNLQNVTNLYFDKIQNISSKQPDLFKSKPYRMSNNIKSYKPKFKQQLLLKLLKKTDLYKKNFFKKPPILGKKIHSFSKTKNKTMLLLSKFHNLTKEKLINLSTYKENLNHLECDNYNNGFYKPITFKKKNSINNKIVFKIKNNTNDFNENCRNLISTTNKRNTNNNEDGFPQNSNDTMYINSSKKLSENKKLNRASKIDRLIFLLEKPEECFEQNLFEHKPKDIYILLKNQMKKTKNRIENKIIDYSLKQNKKEMFIKKYIFKL